MLNFLIDYSIVIHGNSHLHDNKYDASCAYSTMTCLLGSFAD